MYLNHARPHATRDDDIVQGQKVLVFALLLNGGLQHRAFVNPDGFIAVQIVGKLFCQFVGFEFREKTDAPKIDAKNGYIEVGTQKGGMEYGAVSAENNHQIAALNRWVFFLFTLFTQIDAAYLVALFVQKLLKVGCYRGCVLFSPLIKNRNCLHYALRKIVSNTLPVADWFLVDRN